jgi:hypothetical protein
MMMPRPFLLLILLMLLFATLVNQFAVLCRWSRHLPSIRQWCLVQASSRLG